MSVNSNPCLPAAWLAGMSGVFRSGIKVLFICIDSNLFISFNFTPRYQEFLTAEQSDPAQGHKRETPQTLIYLRHAWRKTAVLLPSSGLNWIEPRHIFYCNNMAPKIKLYSLTKYIYNRI